MDAFEAYARQWAKKKDVELDNLSEWIKSIGDVVKRRIRRLKHSVNIGQESIFRDPWCCPWAFPSPREFCYSSCPQSIQYVCLQETLRPHPDRGTWTPFTSWKPYIQSHKLFCIRSLEKKEEIWLRPVTKTLTPTEQSKQQRDNIKTPPKTLIIQLLVLRTDLGRSVEVTAVIQLVWLNRLTSAQPSPLTATALNQKDTYLKICK